MDRPLKCMYRVRRIVRAASGDYVLTTLFKVGDWNRLTHRTSKISVGTRFEPNAKDWNEPMVPMFATSFGVDDGLIPWDNFSVARGSNF